MWDSLGVVGFGTCADREATTADSHYRGREQRSARASIVVILELTGWRMLGRQDVRHSAGRDERRGRGGSGVIYIGLISRVTLAGLGYRLDSMRDTGSNVSDTRKTDSVVVLFWHMSIACKDIVVRNDMDMEPGISRKTKENVYSSSSSSPPSSLLAAAAARLRLTRPGRPPPYGEVSAKSMCFCESRRTTNDGTLTICFPTLQGRDDMSTSFHCIEMPSHRMWRCLMSVRAW